MSDAAGSEYWVISAPKTTGDTFATLKRKVTQEQDLARVFPFAVPDLKVGTLDSLMSLSDELGKVESFVHGVARKVAHQRFVAWEDGDSSSGGAQKGAPPSLNVNGRTIDDFLTFFQWDDSKYPSSQPLKLLTASIHKQTSKLDEELKVKALDYQGVMNQINAATRARTGNLMQRDLSTVVRKEDVTDTDYLTTLFVCVRTSEEKLFLQKYETLCDFVLPRSAKKLDDDGEFVLYGVIMFKRVAEEFTNLARENKFFVRDFKYSETTSGKDSKALEAEKERQKANLMRFCNVNFTEAFVAWIHIVAIRVFVESVLRYGLPTNFQAMLVQPKRGKDKRLRKALDELYSQLGDADVFDDPTKERTEEDAMLSQEQFFPYVSVTLNVEMQPGKLQ